MSEKKVIKILMKIIVGLLVAACFVAVSGIGVQSFEYKALPSGGTNVHTYMDYGFITSKASDQYKLQQDANVYTSRAGLRCYKDENGDVYFLVAMAAYYGDSIGDVFEITLDNGSIFKVMLGDCKGPDTESTYGHSCWNFRTKEYCTNIIEFIVDDDKLPSDVLGWGSITAIDYFDGNVESVEYLGRGWNGKTVKE